MMDSEQKLTIDELAQRAGVAVRTVRYYIAEGLLPGPGSRGKSAAYSAEHLARLQLIRRLVERRVPLAQIRALVARLPLDEARAVLREEERLSEARDAGAPSPKEYISALLRQSQRFGAVAAPSQPATKASRAPLMRPWEFGSATTSGSATLATPPASTSASGDLWRRVELAPGVELHVSAAAEQAQQTLIERLLAAAETAAGQR
ncbi:MAG: MerR family transcriptional regulator [Ktedonobacterales bacterium]